MDSINQLIAGIQLAEQRQDELYLKLKSWRRNVIERLLQRLNTLNVQERKRIITKDSQRLRASLKMSNRHRRGELIGQRLSMSKHGIYLEHGVGKGRPVGSTKAQAAKKAWIEPVLAIAIEELGNILEDQYGDILEEAVAVLIPGILDTRTTN